MSKRLVIILSFLIGALFLIIGCSKSNHEALAILGDESYLKSVDEVYPKVYRNNWPELAPDDYHFDNNVVVPVPDEGLFPPDMNGDYDIRLKYINGDFTVYYNGNLIGPIPALDCVMSLKISNQKNGIAKFDFKLGDKSYPIDNVYIYGITDDDNDKKGRFTLCFNYSENYGDVGGESMVNYYGCIITGIIDNDKISDARCWMVIKDRYPSEIVNMAYVIGGQQFFKSVD